MKHNRIFTLFLLLLLSLSAVAQTPEAVRESIRKYPNLALPTYSTYPSIPLGEIAATPDGFEPFYFSLVGRHGSRYDQSGKSFRKALSVFRKADSLGILTEQGKHLYSHIAEISAAQNGRNGELSELGYNQWLGIAHRAYDHFAPVFASGAIDGKSSTSLRCVLSMVAFNQGIKELSPQLTIYQQARKSELGIVRPLYDNPATPELARKIHKESGAKGEWNKDLNEWEKSSDASSFLSKVTTDRKRLLKECGGKSDFRVLRYSFRALLFGENFELGDRELLTSLFTPEEMYAIYVHQTAKWVNTSIGRGNEKVEMYSSFMRPMVDDIIAKGNAAIEGKNPHKANLRFTHDSYVGPLLSVMGYEGCYPQYSTNIEQATTSFNFGTVVPMAANLQIVLYRNKAGEVLVRSLVNERDAYLPIKCATAPFYPWKEFCKYLENNFKELEKSQKKVLKQYQE